jgi:putative membrane-bound dehydrogenase-like protein
MKIGIGLLFTIIALQTFAQPAPKLILLTQSKGFQHDVVKHKGGEQSDVQKTFATLADKTKLFELETTEDASILTPEKLKDTKIVVFYTTGDLPLDTKAFAQWIKDGGSFLATHTGTDTLANDPIYHDIINGRFNGHPWDSKTTVTLKLNDPKNPTVAMFDPHYTLTEEIYHYKDFQPDAVRVLMSLDMERTEKKYPEHVPVVWCKTYGKGKVFHTELGHREDVWTSEVYQKHLTAAIEWLLGKSEFDATPNPDVSKAEEEISKKACAATQPSASASPLQRAGASTSTTQPLAKSDPPAKAGSPTTSPTSAPVPTPQKMPIVANCFEISPFVCAPDIKSPAGLAVTPDGRVFVGEDEYNSGPDRKMGLSHIKLCVDTDGDGKADKITVFADQINSPQGMCFAGGTLYVTHAPLLTALRDTDGDGVADVRNDLVTGLGPVPEGLVHHIPSGVHIGIDGWLYVAVGDKGIKEATGKDGRKITLHGGGIVRVRPDGTELQVFCTGTRNIYDVAIDPYMNTFTRDNTNDGDGWWSRLTQMQRDAAYGYPNFYKNFGDEMIQPMADYGSGGATGSIYLHEPNLPGDFGDCLYTIDWARGTVYRHQLTPDGATFLPTQEDFVKDIFATHIDVDGTSRLYVSDWARRDWSTSSGVGVIYMIRRTDAPTTAPSDSVAATPASPASQKGDAGFAGTASDTWPDLRRMTSAHLVDQLTHRSAVRRRETQQELLRRGNSAEIDAMLKSSIPNKQLPLYGRVAQLFTLVQLMGAPSHSVISEWMDDADLREFILRALVDRDSQLQGVNPRLFADSLNDLNPRVRVQAALGLGRLRDPSFNAQLVPLTADKQWLVRHAAQQALRLLGGTDACIAAIGSTAKPKLIAGALMVLRSEHDHKTVIAMENLLARDNRTIVKREAITTLSRLYQVEATWDGSWWNTRPDTRGPNYKSARWEESAAVAQMMIKLAADQDEQTANLAIGAIGLCGVSEAVPMLSKLVSTDNPMRQDAANALIQMKSPEALAALEQIALGSTFDPDLRTRAAQTIGSVEGSDATAAIIRMIGKLDAAQNQSPALLDKLTDALSNRAATLDTSSDLVKLAQRAQQRDVRIAVAQSLLKSGDQPVKDRVAKLWDDTDPQELDALLTAASRAPVDSIKPYQPRVEALIQAKQEEVRHSAMVALGHLGDSSAVKVLLSLAGKEVDRVAAASALAEIAPDKAADDQVLPVAQLLTSSSTRLARSTDREAYGKILAAAERFAADKRIPPPEAEKLLMSLKRQGVIYSYQHTDPIPAPSADESFAFVCPPEKAPAGPFETFTVGDATYTWKPLNITDPQGIAHLDMSAPSVAYFTTSVEAPSACSAVLTCGSDDGIQAWVNGTKVMTQDKGRPVKADENRARIQLLPGKNALLFKINNKAGPSGIQARVRWRPTDFEPEQLVDYINSMPTNAQRGKELFTQLSCVKCHTLDAHEEPKGPYLGDVGGKFDVKYIAESILRPNAKIAQGFSTTRIIATDANGKNPSESVGFITREAGDEVQMRDLTGKVMTVNKSHITKRDTLPGSMMPEGLADALSLEDFRSLLAYLQSLKGK